MSPREAQAALRKLADPEKARSAQRFFKTGKGEYGEGDRFLGITVPQVRTLARRYSELTLPEILSLLPSPYNEQRLLALLLLVQLYRKSEPAAQPAVYRSFLQQTRWINNWNLVDSCAHEIVGEHLRTRSRAPLYRLVCSRSMWERRIAIVATLQFIRAGEVEETYRLAELLFADPEDLLHKATGWMLRETGKKNRPALEKFLQRHARQMPRTMLRYALEHFSPSRRRSYLEQ